MPHRKAVPMIININMNLLKKREKKNILSCSLKTIVSQKLSSVDRSCTYLIMSSIIFPMEICSVPKDSWAGRMYARRVKLSMLVTANSTSAIS